MKGCCRLLSVLIILCSMVSGCAVSQNQGRLIRSGDAQRLIESETVLEDHAYYFTGPEAQPDAIIAIKNSLTLQSKYWINVDNDKIEKQLQDWNRIIDNGTRIKNRYEGFNIMTTEGQQVGIWYSKYDHTVIQFPEPSSIILYAPLVPSEQKDWIRFGGPGF